MLGCGGCCTIWHTFLELYLITAVQAPVLPLKIAKSTFDYTDLVMMLFSII